MIIMAERFSFVSPIDSRYIPSDEELLAKIKEYGALDILSKLGKAVPGITLPRLYSLENELFYMASQNKGKQVPRRLDGTRAGEITLGEIFTNYSDRLRDRILGLEKVPLNFKDMEESSRNDKISDLIYFSVSALSVEANIANDIRHLFRTEIGEFSHETFGEERIGSSTMPQKRNPAEFEQVVSMWKAYSPKVISAVLCQMTEHQGDSTNEGLPYISFELLCALSHTTKSLENSLKNLRVNV
jgi:hypothetical protein